MVAGSASRSTSANDLRLPANGPVFPLTTLFPNDMARRGLQSHGVFWAVASVSNSLPSRKALPKYFL
jgi:hypothetical protein